jgi:hypothetical protein
MAVAVMDGDVMIDLGAEQGLAAGDTFVLFRRGEEILHPRSGERIGWQKDVLGRIRLVTTEESLATGELTHVKERGIEIRAGDLAILESMADRGGG